MKRRTLFLAPLFVMICAGYAGAQEQFPIADRVAQKLVQKYQNSSCEQLWQEKASKRNKPKPEAEQKFIQLMRTDPALRADFINRVAAPIVNKMFECGMIP